LPNPQIQKLVTLDWFLPCITQILSKEVPTPTGVSLQFSLSDEAANHNMAILQSFNNNLHDYILANKNSFMSYGSEFRPYHVLEPLLLHHRSWPSLSKQLQEGSKWPLSTLTDEDRLSKNREFISHGNHQSAKKHHLVLNNIISNEVLQGWMIPLPITYINQIPNSEIASVGIDDKQFKTNPDGSKTHKFRLTHDQTFEASMGKSVNNLTLRDQLDPLFYGGCLSRTIHYIVPLRLRHPNTRILGEIRYKVSIPQDHSKWRNSRQKHNDVRKIWPCQPPTHLRWVTMLQ
jgi:hypothetical protein